MRTFKFFYDTKEDEDDLYVELEDINNGEHFGIPVPMNNEISQRGINLYNVGRTTTGRCGYGVRDYWIDNVYRTNDHTLIVEAVISEPTNTARFRVHRIRQIIPFSL